MFTKLVAIFTAMQPPLPWQGGSQRVAIWLGSHGQGAGKHGLNRVQTKTQLISRLRPTLSLVSALFRRQWASSATAMQVQLHSFRMSRPQSLKTRQVWRCWRQHPQPVGGCRDRLLRHIGQGCDCGGRSCVRISEDHSGVQGLQDQ